MKKYIFIKFWLILVFLGSLLLVNAQENSLKEAIKLFEQNKIKDAANIFLQAAKNENAEAFYYLGRIYSEGLGGINCCKISTKQ